MKQLKEVSLLLIFLASFCVVSCRPPFGPTSETEEATSTLDSSDVSSTSASSPEIYSPRRDPEEEHRRELLRYVEAKQAQLQREIASPAKIPTKEEMLKWRHPSQPSFIGKLHQKHRGDTWGRCY